MVIDHSVLAVVVVVVAVVHVDDGNHGPSVCHTVKCYLI